MLFSEFAQINPKVDLKKGESYPFIEMEDITPGKRYIATIKEKLFKGGGSRFQSKDIIFARITPCLEHGKIAQIKGKDNEKYFGSTEFFVFRAKQGISDEGFLFYLSYSDILRKPAEKSMYGASGRQRASLDVVKAIEIPDFPFKSQQKIASILSAYDDLIENNTRRIQILEEMSQRIYREWFVDFRFPGHEKVKFVDSELGKIPEGWEVKSIMQSKYWDFINENVSEYNGKKEYFATANIEGIDIVKDGILVSYQNKPSRAQKQPVVFSVWFARMKDTYKVLGFTKVNEDIANKSILSSGFAGFKTNEFNFSFIYLTINSNEFHQKKDQYCTGATQMSLTNDGLQKIKIIEPTKNTIEEFGKLILPLLNKIFAMQKINKVLRTTRDLLLPKLISGELDVSDMDIRIRKENS
jgi:type I restriction enzyme S subunit